VGVGLKMPIAFWLILVFLLIIFAGFFAAAEIGMMSINRYRLRHLVKTGVPKAQLIFEQLNHPEKLLSSVLIGNTLANIFASMAMTFVGQRLYAETGVAVAEIILTIVLLVFAEMAPKTLAAHHPEKTSFALIYPLRVLQWVFWPLSYMTTYLSHAVLTLFGVSHDKMVREKLSYEELRAVMKETEGWLGQEHQAMLLSLLDLERAQVEDVMIPASEIIGIDVTEPWVDILEQLMTMQHTRVPLYRHSVDRLIGVVHIRSVMQMQLNGNLDLEHLLNAAEEPLFIPAGTALNVQILQFRSKRARSGFVVNEYGDLLGLVTMEDILEEVVGEFTTDVTDLYEEIIPQEDGDYVIDASISLKQLYRILGWEFPQIGPRTLSGLIIEHLGYIPSAESCLKMFDYQITILRMEEQMIKTVRINKLNLQ
jgi:Mg2+/Co2+ transporter CorB